jgi:hypothetical protein
LHPPKARPSSIFFAGLAGRLRRPPAVEQEFRDPAPRVRARAIELIVKISERSTPSLSQVAHGLIGVAANLHPSSLPANNQFSRPRSTGFIVRLVAPLSISVEPASKSRLKAFQWLRAQPIAAPTGLFLGTFGRWVSSQVWIGSKLGFDPSSRNSYLCTCHAASSLVDVRIVRRRADDRRDGPEET